MNDPGYELQAAMNASLNPDLLGPWLTIAEQMDPVQLDRYQADLDRYETRRAHGELFADMLTAALTPNDHARRVLDDLITEGTPE